MNTLDELLESPASPAAYVDALSTLARASHAARHPVLVAIAQGRFRDPRRALRAFLLEYHAYSRSFTRHLAAVTASLDDPCHRAALVPNAAEEAGDVPAEHLAELAAVGLAPEDASAPHPELLRRFLTKIGLPEPELAAHRPHVATTAWIETFHDVCRGDAAQGIGALGIATEGIVRGMYGLLLDGIRGAFPELDTRDCAFFVLHAAVDDDHADVLRSIAIELAETADARRRMAIGVSKALVARGAFFDAMLGVLARVDGAARAA